MPRFLKRILGAVVIALILLAINMAMSKEGFFGIGVDLYYVDIVKMVGIAVILAVSLNLINGFTGQFSIGHIGFMAIGAYSSAYLTVYCTQGWEQSLAGMLGAQAAAAIIFTLVILVGALTAAIAGLIVGIPTLRLRGDYLAIATLGFAEIIRIVIVNINKVGAATGFRGCVDPATGATCADASMGRLTIPAYTNFMWIGVFAVITIVVIYNIVHSDTGRALISIREDELAAQAMGVNTTRYKVTAFVISAAFAGVAGALYGHWRLPHPNDFTFVRSFEIIIMIVLGGMGSITGAVLGAVVITILPEFLRIYPYEIIILLALIPLTILILRAIGSNRLSQRFQGGLGRLAFVAGLYLVLFGIARFPLMDIVLNLDFMLVAFIPLTAAILNLLPQFLRTGPGHVILVVVLFGLAVLLIQLFGRVGQLNDLPNPDLVILGLVPLIGVIVSLRAFGRNRLAQVVQSTISFVLIYLALFVVGRLVLHQEFRVLAEVVGNISKYRLVIYSALLIGMMLTRPQGLLGGREFGFSWLKRSQRSSEGDDALGGSGVPIAESDDPTVNRAKEVDNQ